MQIDDCIVILHELCFTWTCQVVISDLSFLVELLWLMLHFCLPPFSFCSSNRVSVDEGVSVDYMHLFALRER